MKRLLTPLRYQSRGCITFHGSCHQTSVRTTDETDCTAQDTTNRYDTSMPQESVKSPVWRYSRDDAQVCTVKQHWNTINDNYISISNTSTWRHCVHVRREPAVIHRNSLQGDDTTSPNAQSRHAHVAVSTKATHSQIFPTDTDIIS